MSLPEVEHKNGCQVCRNYDVDLWNVWRRPCNFRKRICTEEGHCAWFVRVEKEK